jgi:hypothetical protein
MEETLFANLDGKKFCSSKLDGFFPKLDLKISSQTLKVQELLSKA